MLIEHHNPSPLRTARQEALSLGILSAAGRKFVLYQAAKTDLAASALKAGDIIVHEIAFRPFADLPDGYNVKFQPAGLVADGACRRTGPDALQVVEFTHFRAEEMYDQIAGVDQHPIGIGQALNTGTLAAEFLDLALNMVGQGGDMPSRSARGDDHLIGNGGFAGEIQDKHVFGLVVFEAGQYGRADLVTLIGDGIVTGLTL